MAAHPRSQARLAENPVKRVGDALRILTLDQESRAVSQQLDRMRKTGRDHRLPRCDGLDQDTGGNLLQRVIRQNHDVRGADNTAQRIGRQVPADATDKIPHTLPRPTPFDAPAAGRTVAELQGPIVAPRTPTTYPPAPIAQ